MSVVRARRAKAKMIALTLQTHYRGLAEARGTDEVQTAAIKLGDTFNTNIEFIINVMRDYGGLDAKFEPMTTAAPAKPVLIGMDFASGPDRCVLHPTGQDLERQR